MSRRINTVGLEASGGSPADTFFDRVIKYIPADIVGAWVAVTGIIAANQASGTQPDSTLLWIAFVIGVILTFAWTWKQTLEPKKPPAWKQIVISTFAFVVWVFALGGPFATLGFWKPMFGSLLLILYSLVVALVVPKE